MHVYEVHPRKDKRGANLVSDTLPSGRLWYAERDAVDYAKFYSRSHDAVIRVYDAAANVIKTHEHKAISKSHKPSSGLKIRWPVKGPCRFESGHRQFLLCGFPAAAGEFFADSGKAD